MEELINENAFWSAVKRKNMLDLLGLIFEDAGLVEAAQECKDSTRVTEAFIKRIKDLMPTGAEQAEDEFEDGGDVCEEIEPTLDEDEVEHKEPEAEDEVEEVTDIYDDIKKAIKKGKGKKALKLIKKARKGGSSGSVLENLAVKAEAL